MVNLSVNPALCSACLGLYDKVRQWHFIRKCETICGRLMKQLALPRYSRATISAIEALCPRVKNYLSEIHSLNNRLVTNLLIA